MRRVIYAGLGAIACWTCAVEREESVPATFGSVRQASTNDAGDVCSAGGGARTPFAGGTGTPADPYIICSLAQLDRIRGSYLASNFALHADIDASITNPLSPLNPGSAWSGGAGFDPIGNCGPDQKCNAAEDITTGDDVPFTGSFDGLGHAISHLYIHRPTQVGAGLFGKIAGSNVGLKNLSLPDVDITARGWVGGAVGFLMASLSRCTSSGRVNAATDFYYGGGLIGAVGSIRGPSITNTVSQSSSSVNVSGGTSLGGLVGDVQWGAVIVECYAIGSVSGGEQVGGLVGDMYNGTIRNSYATGSVTGTGCIGGLNGYGDFSTITNAFATGAVLGTTQVGGLSGCEGNTMLTGSFATGMVTGTSKVGGLDGEKWGGTITNAYWSGGAEHPTVMCGYNRPSEPGTGCADQFIVTAPTSYWYSAANPPLSAWDGSIWSFHADQYPTLTNALSVPVSFIQDGGVDAIAPPPFDASSDVIAPPPFDASRDASPEAGNTPDGASGGAPGAGGSAGGSAGRAGGGGSGGSSASGGRGGSGGASGSTGAMHDAGADASTTNGGSDSGCSCRTAAPLTPRRDRFVALLALAIATTTGARRRRK